MQLFLTSSPCMETEGRLNPANGFEAALQEACKGFRTALFICSSPDSPELTERFSAEMREAIALSGIEFEEWRILDGRNTAVAGLLIAESDLIVLAGGHVPTQNAFFRQINLRERLADWNGVVLGISAGTMNAADEVYIQPELEGESLDPDFDRFGPGLGLTSMQILPHLQKERDAMLDGRRLYDDITLEDSAGHCFYALPDGSWLGGSREGQTLYGEAWRIRDGEMTQILQNGETLQIS